MGWGSSWLTCLASDATGGGLSRGEHFREKQCNKFGSLIQNQSIFRFLNSRFCSLYRLRCQAESEDCLKCFKDLSPQKLALHCYL